MKSNINFIFSCLDLRNYLSETTKHLLKCFMNRRFSCSFSKYPCLFVYLFACLYPACPDRTGPPPGGSLQSRRRFEPSPAPDHSPLDLRTMFSRKVFCGATSPLFPPGILLRYRCSSPAPGSVRMLPLGPTGGETHRSCALALLRNALNRGGAQELLAAALRRMRVRELLGSKSNSARYV